MPVLHENLWTGVRALSFAAQLLECRRVSPQARHSNINDLIHRCLNRAGIPAIKEPSGLTRSDGKRPDGQTLIPWSGGRTLLWDATVIDTVTTSYIQETAAAAGGAAEMAAAMKHTKYEELEGDTRLSLSPLKRSVPSKERVSTSYRRPEVDFQLLPVTFAKQSSCSRVCQRRFNVSTQWPFKELCQGCQESTISVPGLRTGRITTSILNNSVS